MNYPKCLYRDNNYLIVPDEAHHKGAKAVGWQESHAHIVGLPDKYRGSVPLPIYEDAGPAVPDEVVERAIEDDPITEEEMQEAFELRFKKKAIWKGKPTKKYLEWKKGHK